MKSIEEIAQKIEMSSVSKSDLDIISEISPDLGNNMKFLEKWFSGEDVTNIVTCVETSDKTKPIEIPVVMGEINTTVETFEKPDDIEPDSEWKFVYDHNIYISDKGTIYSQKSHQVLKTYFIDGDLRVFLDGEELPRRAAPLVCKAFAIHSMNRNCDYIINYTDGDRRNISPYNLGWVAKDSSYNPKRFYIEDICRRIVDCGGNIDEVLKYYEDSKPVTTKRCIEMIISKELHPGISDRFFYNVGGKIVPVDSPIAEPYLDEKTDPIGSCFDVSGFFMASNDKKMTVSLIRDKIKKGEELFPAEQVIVILSTIEQIGGKNIPDVKKISKVVKDQFGITIPLDTIDQVRNDFTSEIAKAFRS